MQWSTVNLCFGRLAEFVRPARYAGLCPVGAGSAHPAVQSPAGGLEYWPPLWYSFAGVSRAQALRRGVNFFCVLFTAGIIMGRFVSGVHWPADIVGGELFSFNLIQLYCVTISLFNCSTRAET